MQPDLFRNFNEQFMGNFKWTTPAPMIKKSIIPRLEVIGISSLLGICILGCSYCFYNNSFYILRVGKGEKEEKVKMDIKSLDIPLH